MRRMPLVFLVMMSFSAACAAECPAASTEDVLSALRSARSCRGAAQTYKTCTRATTQDVEFAEVVIGKCETGFLARPRQPDSRREAAGPEAGGGDRRRCRSSHRKRQNAGGVLAGYHGGTT